jgi:hypothetical protein
MSLPSGLNAKNSIFGYIKTALIESGLFCIYLKIEYAIFSVKEKKYSKIILHRNDMCAEIEY